MFVWVGNDKYGSHYSDYYTTPEKALKSAINYSLKYRENLSVQDTKTGKFIYDVVYQKPLVIDLKKENPDNGTE